MADYESIVFALGFGVSAFAFIAELTFLGLDSIPDSYTNPNQGTNKSIDSYEVGTYGDLVRRRKLNGQGSQFDIRHVPQKAVASDVVPGYSQPPFSPDEPAIAIPRSPINEHSPISLAQARNNLDRFQSNPSQEDLVVRDFFHLRNYTKVPISNLKNLAEMIRSLYPSIFRRYR